MIDCEYDVLFLGQLYKSILLVPLTLWGVSYLRLE